MMSRTHFPMILAWITVTILSVHGEARDKITIHGSDTMLILNNELAAEYGKVEPSITFKVIGGGSGRGIEALLSRKTDLAAASREMNKNEFEIFEKKYGKRPMEITVALDGIGVYVHNNNPISSLTLAQFSKILTGEIRNWREVGGTNRRIDVYNRDKFSGTREFIEERLLRGKPFTSQAHEVSTTSMLTSSVSRSQGAIGYGGIAYSPGAHIIRLAAEPGEIGVWPSRENVSSGTYPLSRRLYYYADPDGMDPELCRFVDWVQSPEGQHVVTFVGYYPAPALAAGAFDPSDEPAPVINADPVLLTPDNMRQHGFDISVRLMDANLQAIPGQVDLVIQFHPDGQAIQRVQSLSIRIGEDIEVPLNLMNDQSIQISLRKTMVNGSTLLLSERGAPGNGMVYMARLGAFCKVD